MSAVMCSSGSRAEGTLGREGGRGCRGVVSVCERIISVVVRVRGLH